GARAGLPEGNRQRDFLRQFPPPHRRAKAKRSAVIPVMTESNTIQQVVQSVRLAGVDEIIVVANGSDQQTIQRARETGATVLTFPERLGHNVGRAIGAAYSTGDTCLFVDSDMVIPASQLRPFIDAIESGIDVALND